MYVLSVQMYLSFSECVNVMINQFVSEQLVEGVSLHVQDLSSPSFLIFEVHV